MALIVLVAGTARLSIQPPVQILRPRRLTFFSTLSTPPRGGDAVDWLEATSKFFEQDSRPIMLFDGVKFVRDNDRQRKIRFEALQSEAGKNLLRRSGRVPDDISSVVLVEKNRFVRDFAYEKIADNRYSFLVAQNHVKFRTFP